TQPTSGKRRYRRVWSRVSADGRRSVPTGAPSRSTTMSPSLVRRPLSPPDAVIATCRSSIRIEKLLLVAGVHPRAASSRTLATSSAAQRSKASALYGSALIARILAQGTTAALGALRRWRRRLRRVRRNTPVAIATHGP